VTASAAPADAHAWQGDDPVSRAVRAGYDVVEKAVRRGFGLGGDAPGAQAFASPWAASTRMGPWSPTAGSWTTGQWIDAMTGAAAQWTQWVDAWATMARSMIGGDGRAWSPPQPPVGASDAGTAWSARPPEVGGDHGSARPPEVSDDHWPARPTEAGGSARPPEAAPASSSGPRVTVELRSARAVTVELDLSSAALPPAGTALEVHGLVAPPAAAAPPITDVAVAVVDAGFTIALGSLEHQPAGTYAGAVLVAGRACGTLTVRLS